MKLYCAFCLKSFEGKHGTEFCSPAHREEQAKAERLELQHKRQQLRLPSNSHSGKQIVSTGAYQAVNFNLSDHAPYQ